MTAQSSMVHTVQHRKRPTRFLKMLHSNTKDCPIQNTEVTRIQFKIKQYLPTPKYIHVTKKNLSSHLVLPYSYCTTKISWIQHCLVHLSNIILRISFAIISVIKHIINCRIVVFVVAHLKIKTKNSLAISKLSEDA